MNGNSQPGPERPGLAGKTILIVNTAGANDPLHSKKAFIRKITGNAPAELISGTLAASVLAVVKGAQIVRVHDLKAVRDGLKVADAIMRKNQYA